MYNQIIHGLPHSYPATSEEFSAALFAAASGAPGDERLHSENAHVTWEDGTPLGFIHTAIERPRREGSDPRGIIRFACYRRRHRAAGQALLTTAEDSFLEHGIATVLAFHQFYVYDFYHLPSVYLSDRLEHIHALMGFNGYKRVAGEVYLNWRNFTPYEPPQAGVDANVTLTWRKGTGERPDLVLTAQQGNERVGECACKSLGHPSRPEENEDWLFTDWIGVSETVRGRGLGRHLLRRALLEMHAVGYRHAAISTAWDNHRALLFYSNFGYSAVDWTYGLGKELPDAA
jgi:ribosomal protein S18 acetylase RimI-like enzyme